ncbi:MAG: hypothetical protein JO246_05350 [Frankiaceae bacterium]|nr:hypothetical protein [Frankiaceae bacterium]MBV9870621.1 hypothetical protein [Frankiaceae bacterium]
MAQRGTPTPGELGLPEHSALTIEGRVERAALVGTHLARRRRGAEERLRKSPWAMGLGLILGVLALVIAVSIGFYLAG